MATQIAGAPYSLAAGEGEQLSWFDATMTLKASAPGLSVIDAVIGPGDEPPLHVHESEDEWFYLLEGEVSFHVGDEILRGRTGSFVSFPRGLPHTFTIESASARFLLINTPGGFERMFELAPKTVEEAVQALNQYGVEVVGPHQRNG